MRVPTRWDSCRSSEQCLPCGQTTIDSIVVTMQVVYDIRSATPESAKPHDEEERAFLQQRLAQFAKWAFFLSVASTVVSIATGAPADLFSLAWFLDHAVMVLMAAMWFVCSRGEHSIRWLRAIDAGVAVLTGVFVALLGRFLRFKSCPMCSPARAVRSQRPQPRPASSTSTRAP